MARSTLKTPVGMLTLEGDEEGLQKVFFDENSYSTIEVEPCLQEAVEQIAAYFDGKRTQFSLTLNPDGTTFQKRVWQQLLEIPHGKTRSYQEIANQLGDPKVIRAAATANGKNPIAIIIPCHRVIGSDGSLTGYAGGLHRKKWLLDHENPYKQGELF